ncbi:MAG: GHKL domain-containing protein [Desulfobacteraceae bacterium]|nr:GHKL domain-containing protein [Desulfobacteraceae bacterium]
MALKNIIKNATEAMNEKGKLTISVQYIESGLVELKMSDTGSGIAPEHIEKVFEPMFSTKTHGIGFGLSITKMIIENHGGTVRAESDEETKFIISLPIGSPL